MNREYYIDNLRILLTVLVIFHHTAIGYGAMGGWCYVTPETVSGIPQIVLSLILVINQAFFMSLFFFISAYFMPRSLEKKGTKKYLKDRFVRLGIPLLFVMLIMNPILLYGIARYTNNTNGTCWTYVLNEIQNNPNTSVMWFVLTLLIFETVYIFLRKISGISISNLIADKIPSAFQITVFILICGILAFGLRTFYPIGRNFIGLQFGFFVLYSAMYFMGIAASRKNWLERLSFESARSWLLVVIAFLPVIIIALIKATKNPAEVALYQGGLNYKAVILAVWEAITCTGLCYFFLVYFKNRINIASKWSQIMASDSYTVYIIHPVLVVAFTMLLEGVPINPLIRFTFAFTLSVTACFTAARMIRKIPGITRIL